MTEEIFSRCRRRLNRQRALRSPAESRWLVQRTIEELVERLSFMTIDVRKALVFGDGATQLRSALPASCEFVCADIVSSEGVDVVADEDRLPVEAGAFDLVLANGTLESIHDLPGALILMRRALRPGGLFLGSITGGGSYAAFRALIHGLEHDANGGHAARFHPQIDVRSAGDLLFRAGFSTPVADMETTAVHYSSARKLLSDIRGAGLGNAFPQVHRMARMAGRNVLNSGEIEEQISTIFLTGWSPALDEVRPSGPVKGFG